MPFYIRTSPRRPLWYPALWGAGPMLVWTVVQALRVGHQVSGPLLGGLARGLYVVALTLLAGAVAGAVYWSVDAPRLRHSPLLRLIPATAGVALYLTMLTLGADLAKPEGPWMRLARPAFILGTGLVSLLFGWFIARDPFDIAARTQRVYLTPAEVAALTPSQRALLVPDLADRAGPDGPSTTG
jgi:hypothetical protein